MPPSKSAMRDLPSGDRQAQIEAAYGQPLMWEALPERHASRVAGPVEPDAPAADLVAPDVVDDLTASGFSRRARRGSVQEGRSSSVARVTASASPLVSVIGTTGASSGSAGGWWRRSWARRRQDASH